MHSSPYSLNINYSYCILFSGFVLFLLFPFTHVIASAPGGANASTSRAQNESVAKAVKLQSIADSLLDQMNYREAEKLLQEAYVLASKSTDKRLAGKIANNLAECYSMTGRSEKAVSTYKQAYNLFASLGDTNAMAVMLINLGDEYAKTGNQNLAAETELRAIKLKENSHDYRKLAFYYQKLGELFIDTDRNRWEYYVMKALALSRTEEYTTLRATIAIYNDLGAIWRLKGDYKRAAAYYDTMYRMSVDAGHIKGIATATSEKALMLFEQQHYAEALPLAEQAFEMIKDKDDQYKIVYEETLTARILIKLGQSAKAVTMLENAAQRAHCAGLKNEEKEAYRYLTEALKLQSKWEAALIAQQQYINLKDSLNNVEIQGALNEMQTRFETEKKQQIIDHLNEQNGNHLKRNRLLMGLLSASALVLILLAFSIRLRNKTISQDKILMEREKEIHRLENDKLRQDLEFKNRELSAATLHLINKNEVLNDLRNKLSGSAEVQPGINQAIRQIDQTINLDQDWQKFSRHFGEVHPDFFRKLKMLFPAITPNEERLCAYLAINLNTKEISQMLNVTTAAIDKSRNRLRKKLNVGPEVNLNDFLISL